MEGNISFGRPSLIWSLVPLGVLVGGLAAVLLLVGAESMQTYAQPLLIGAALVSVFIGMALYRRPVRPLLMGFVKSGRQILPALPILLLIATVSATWMMSGVVPALIVYGMQLLDPTWFLVTTCGVCAIVSVLSGSSWTTIATIGVAFMGIGTVWGFNPGWTAGAIISGAYFGDKVSPLSDTTVLAASTCSVPLFSHIRYMMFTTVPAMSLALIVFGIVGITMDVKEAGVQSAEMTGALHAVFNISPWVLVVPLFTILVLLLRAGTLLTLVLGTLAGIVAVFLFQPQLLPIIDGDAAPDVWSHIKGVIGMLSTETSLDTGNELLDSLTTTGGMAGMLPTITLVLSAMVFASALMGTGMLFTITHSITSRLRKSRNIVYSTVATGLVLNSCTGDQYLSIILNGNLYRNLYRRRRLEPRLLSRSIEDSTSVTSVLIPWNSCGLTQSTVLGVATLTYLPYCLFNILSPVMTIVVASIGYRLHQRCNTIITSEPSESVVAMRR